MSAEDVSAVEMDAWTLNAWREYLLETYPHLREGPPLTLERLAKADELLKILANQMECCALCRSGQSTDCQNKRIVPVWVDTGKGWFFTLDIDQCIKLVKLGVRSIDGGR